MKQFLGKYGKALDFSGAFFASMAGFIAAYHEAFGLALGLWLAAMAFFASYRAWNAPDHVEYRFNRTMCALLAALSAMAFLSSLFFWMMS